MAGAGARIEGDSLPLGAPTGGADSMVQRHDFVQETYRLTDEWKAVLAIADDLALHLRLPATSALLLTANQPGQSSAMVQRVFREEAQRLGFRDESRGLFETYQSGLRPDYFREVGDTGIILEVERGKTTINNMDLLDFWKCHICEHADYLFLMVPSELRQNATMSSRREFATVKRRMESFFVAGNYTNVRGLVLIGY
ncbi:MAG: hypothetical protein JWM47_1530 [Acidimicrobiales bacterium]|nr:hypothetical protein [Acidimicrobiales bacterium]